LIFFIFSLFIAEHKMSSIYRRRHEFVVFIASNCAKPDQT